MRTAHVYHVKYDIRRFINCLVEPGPCGHVFRNDLEAVVTAEFMAPDRRAHAAYALARFYPDEPQWRKVLQELSRRGGDESDAADRQKELNCVILDRKLAVQRAS